MQSLRVLSWNILHGGGTRCPQILEAIEYHQPDIICLQEFRHGKSEAIIIEGLSALGLASVYAPQTQSARDNSVLIASRYPLQAESFPDSTLPARAIKATIETPSSVVLNLITVHFPQKKAQIPYFDALINLPQHWRDEKSLLIGDFNCGIPFVDSETKTFYATHWFQQLLDNGWIDEWRRQHPEAREYSWVSTRKSNGFRYDHALFSAGLAAQVVDIRYDHSVRESKASDHSLLLTDLNI